MLKHRFLLIFPLMGLALSACAYAPEGVEPRWTDAQLQSVPPGEAPAFVPEERLNPLTITTIDDRERRLLERRDGVQSEAGEIPEADGAAEDYAAEARERATPPTPN